MIEEKRFFFNSVGVLASFSLRFGKNGSNIIARRKEYERFFIPNGKNQAIF